MFLFYNSRAWQTHVKSKNADTAHFIILVRIKAYNKVPLSANSVLTPGKQGPKVVSHGFLILCDLASFERLKMKKPNEQTPAKPAWGNVPILNDSPDV